MDISFAMEGLFEFSFSFLGNLYVFEKTVFSFCSVAVVNMCMVYDYVIYVWM